MPSDIDSKRLGLDDVNYSREQYYKYIFIANTLDACMFRFTMYSLEKLSDKSFCKEKFKHNRNCKNPKYFTFIPHSFLH